MKKFLLSIHCVLMKILHLLLKAGLMNKFVGGVFPQHTSVFFHLHTYDLEFWTAIRITHIFICVYTYNNEIVYLIPFESHILTWLLRVLLEMHLGYLCDFH